MAKGQAAKQEVIATILEAFGDNAFMYNDGKEVRVNCSENGEKVQIKIALTCAKVMVEAGADNAIPGAGIKKDNASPFPEPLANKAAAAGEKQSILLLENLAKGSKTWWTKDPTEVRFRALPFAVSKENNIGDNAVGELATVR
jgi:hypothetical protein